MACLANPVVGFFFFLAVLKGCLLKEGMTWVGQLSLSSPSACLCALVPAVPLRIEGPEPAHPEPRLCQLCRLM